MEMTRISTLCDNLRILLDLIREKENEIEDNLVRIQEITDSKYGDLYNHIKELADSNVKIKEDIEINKKQLTETIKHLNDCISGQRKAN